MPSSSLYSPSLAQPPKEFPSRNQRYCYPLTVTDHASRYLLLCEALEFNQEQPAFMAFEGCVRRGPRGTIQRAS